ncbi:mitogen-activated protein kinase 14-like [Dorcoceras hygrometricum]|uniref:Mitogen-activated protein kinase 14-like n=1 Tax=Dorcoceras hygrometricum TaxID=472368 RepID=A0A2Z7A4P3_9LAMI|nr:mitogen-activated protein kinase 14-like [Dorcoceras hygrometricum]
MTSAMMSSQSADEESSAGALSVDDISSDVINQQQATVHSALATMADPDPVSLGRSGNSADGFALRTSRYNSQEKPAGSLYIQTQATVHPVVSYNEPAVSMHPVASTSRSTSGEPVAAQ